MLSVYTRHAADCAKAKDKDWRRWEKAEEYRRLLEGVSSPTPDQTDESVRIADRAPTGHHRDQKKVRVTVETAVEAYLSAARSRGLESSTLSKLEGIFRKQFLAWCSSQGYKFLDEVDLDALLTFRDTWIDGPLAKRKKQERLIGFF
jgi:integrase/recombinase XerD